MKTKIIYISGNELFDMADIRSAFEEVRTALSLGPDTVLFGVPVDNDDTLAVTNQTTDAVSEPIVEHVAEPDIEPIEEPVVAKKSRKSAKVVPITQAIKPEKDSEQAQEKATETDEPVVPILSVLGSETENDTTNTTDKDVIPEPVPDVIQESVSDTESVTISDMIADDVPEAAPEKTLEELLESMTPLGEDADKVSEPESDEQESVPDVQATPDADDTDMTLEKLATEFVENQDKIDTPSKPTSRGKISKLKNILPFKKAKHDDSGLMGDLFGWAGVAANDEDFTIPGFFK